MKVKELIALLQDSTINPDADVEVVVEVRGCTFTFYCDGVVDTTIPADATEDGRTLPIVSVIAGDIK